MVVVATMAMAKTMAMAMAKMLECDADGDCFRLWMRMLRVLPTMDATGRSGSSIGGMSRAVEVHSVVREVRLRAIEVHVQRST